MLICLLGGVFLWISIEWCGDIAIHIFFSGFNKQLPSLLILSL